MQKKLLKIAQMEIDMIDLIKAHLQNILMLSCGTKCYFKC